MKILIRRAVSEPKSEPETMGIQSMSATHSVAMCGYHMLIQYQYSVNRRCKLSMMLFLLNEYCNSMQNSIMVPSFFGCFPFLKGTRIGL
jgi:hypothetical protein